MLRMLCIAVLFGYSLSQHGAVVAQTNEQQPPTYRLHVRPAAKPTAALAIRLLPSALERRPGNAAVLYNKLGHQDLRSDPVLFGAERDKLNAWLQSPLAELPLSEVRRVVGRWETVLADLDLAARRERCDWELPLRERDLISLLLPEVQATGIYGWMIAVRTRLLLAEGKFDEATESLKTGYGLSLHVSEGPTLIHSLVAMSIAQTMDDQLRAMIEIPGSPNMYWALTMFPSPRISLSLGIEVERSMLSLSMPVLNELDAEGHSAAFWKQQLDLLAVKIGQWQGIEAQPEYPLWRTFAMSVRGYPRARQLLLERGLPATDIEAMPVAQVVLTGAIYEYQGIQDESSKWFYLPYPIARERMLAAEEKLRQLRGREILPLATMLTPAVNSVRERGAHCDRSAAMLRAVEALRLHAAMNRGRMPQTLDDVTDAPIPVDPLSGRPFSYTLQENIAVLEAPLLPGMWAKESGLRYEIVME